MSRPSKTIDRFTTAADVTITDNQRGILLRLFAGMLGREIAEQTGRKPNTIVNTLLRVRTQLGARTEYDLMRECLRRGIVTLDAIYERAAPSSAPYRVTDNQRAILLRLFAGMLQREIAAQTGREAITIAHTLVRVRAGLSARTEYDLMRECLGRGIVTLEDVYALADTLHPPATEPPRDTGG